MIINIRKDSWLKIFILKHKSPSNNHNMQSFHLLAFNIKWIHPEEFGPSMEILICWRSKVNTAITNITGEEN